MRALERKDTFNCERLFLDARYRCLFLDTCRGLLYYGYTIYYICVTWCARVNGVGFTRLFTRAVGIYGIVVFVSRRIYDTIDCMEKPS